ncbi:MAG TPA: serine/threonine-protein kinase [Kofleriaceae bacterium]|jgi:serine/threonine protein kinase|nr:serine/threonine-protein kinase [Kofleriaceae bacterium]
MVGTSARHELEPPTVRDGRRATPPAHRLRPGTELAGRYRVLGVLGEGGWGVVYRARDLTLELDVALKVLHPSIASDPSRAAAFRNEVRVARMVTHPNVCRLHDLVEASGACFITMELVAGEALSARIARGPLPLPEALRILRDVASGLAAAHAAGIIHRDLKPANVLLAGDRALIADFGIACERRACERRVAGAGPLTVVGTRGYMAPEQATGAAIDARIDVYALGLLAMALVTDQRASQAINRTVHASDDLPPAIIDPTPWLDGVDPELAAVIRDCLAIAPGDRPRDAGAVLPRLEALAPTARLLAAPPAAARLLAATITAPTAAAIATTPATAPAAPVARLDRAVARWHRRLIVPGVLGTAVLLALAWLAAHAVR